MRKAVTLTAILKRCFPSENIITDPSVVIADNLEQLKPIATPVQAYADAGNSDTLHSNIDTIINQLNKIRLNNSPIPIRELRLAIVVTDINFACG